MKPYPVKEDIEYIMECLNLNSNEFADMLGVNKSTIFRWKNGESNISERYLEKMYQIAYDNDLRLNEVKEQIFKEMYSSSNEIVLFHGAKKELTGDSIRLNESSNYNDFGKGFYLGETFMQSSTFVAGHKKSSVFSFVFNTDKLKSVKFNVDNDWMMAIACYRGSLGRYENSQVVCQLKEKIEKADYVIAPIADNRMFEVINEFISGNITDIQCKHCLSATNLGFQYVLRSEKAIEQLECLSRNYLCEKERKKYLLQQNENHRISEDKLRYAKREFRNQGEYIDELIREESNSL